MGAKQAGMDAGRRKWDGWMDRLVCAWPNEELREGGDNGRRKSSL
jgi:hypothetical protein